MPYDDPDAEDPNVLVGVELPGSLEQLRDTAYVFADEFARMGQSEEQLVALFQTPFYLGAYRAWEALGEAEIRRIVAESVAVWSGFRVRIVDAPEDAAKLGPRRLPVLR